jgi:aspartate 1-decarboxylase
MRITVCKSKIHRATVTDSCLDYEGSLTIDAELIEKANLHVYEKILVANINNGNRFETYVISGERGSKKICLNGAAANLGKIGDRIIILSFTHIEESEIKNFKPNFITLNKNNEIIESKKT